MSHFATIVKENITKLLGDRGISIRELGRRTGIANSALSVMLSGDREIQTDTIQRIADALEVDVMEVVTRHEVVTH